MRKITLLTGAAAAALALGGTGFAMADGGAGPQAGGGAAHPPSAKRTGSIIACDGGVQKAVHNRINNQFSTFSEGADFDVPGSVVVKGPHRGKDTLSITFSAESQLRGGAERDYFDWMELEVLVDGKPIQPYGPPDSPLALTGSREYASNSAQFCTKVGRGKHEVRVVTRLVDNGNDDALTGWLDDTVLRVEQSQ